MEIRLVGCETLDNKELHSMRKEILIIKLKSSPIEKLIQEISKTKNSALMVQEKHFEYVAQNIRYAIQEAATLKESVYS